VENGKSPPAFRVTELVDFAATSSKMRLRMPRSCGENREKRIGTSIASGRAIDLEREFHSSSLLTLDGREHMNDQHESPELRGARDRAAEIRSHWSPAERRIREGLPPDTPWALLQAFFQSDRRTGYHGFGQRGRQWQAAPVVVPR
jgi:hypothetical protein